MALTLAVGLVVDDAIVMLENIFRYLEQGDDRLTAALKGAGEIGFTIVSITVSLIAVFIPILFMGGIIGRLFRDRKSTRLNSSHSQISYAVFCLKKKSQKCSGARVFLEHGFHDPPSRGHRRPPARRVACAVRSGSFSPRPVLVTRFRTRALIGSA